MRGGESDSLLERALESAYGREAEARVVLDADERSGLSAAGFASRHGLAPARLQRWQRRLGGRDGSSGGADGALAFLPVRLRESVGTGMQPSVAPQQHEAPVEIVVARYVVREGAGFEAEVRASVSITVTGAV